MSKQRYQVDEKISFNIYVPTARTHQTVTGEFDSYKIRGLGENILRVNYLGETYLVPESLVVNKGERT